MPYILQERRKVIDQYIDESIEGLSNAQRIDVSVFYKKIFTNLAREVYGLMTSNVVIEGPSKLAQAIVAAGGKDAVYGNLHYALSQIVQNVPKRMKELGMLEKEYNYNTHVFTVGALYKATLGLCAALPDDGVSATLLGVYMDAVMEYKRRLNVGYEERKARENGDAYPAQVQEPNEFEIATIEAINRLVERVSKLETKKATKKVAKKRKEEDKA